MKSWMYRTSLKGYVLHLGFRPFQIERADSTLPGDQTSWKLPPRGGRRHDGAMIALSYDQSDDCSGHVK